MGKLNDVTIRRWIRSEERFEGRSDGEGLVLTWRKDTGSPFWKFRYRFAGTPRVMNLGSYSDLPLSVAHQAAKELRAKVALGHDVAGEKQERKTVALAKIEAARTVMTVQATAPQLTKPQKWFALVRYIVERILACAPKPNLGPNASGTG